MVSSKRNLRSFYGMLYSIVLPKRAESLKMKFIYQAHRFCFQQTTGTQTHFSDDPRVETEIL